MENLGTLRRTRYAREVGEENGEVALMGWVHDIRDLGGVRFFLMRDRTGIIQVTFKRGKTSDELMQKFSALGREYVVAVRGNVEKSERAPRGIELFPTELKILNTAAEQLPLDVTDKVKADLDTRLNARVLDLRKPRVNAVFRIRDRIFSAARDYFSFNNFLEIHTPKIIKAGAEGGATLFPISYFDQEAFLSQSPQLYKEVLTSCFDRVYEISPFFRAEPSDTVRHISEFIGIDAELAFGDENDVMKVVEDLFYHVALTVKTQCAEELEILGRKMEIPKPPYKRLPYTEALEMLREKGEKLEFGEDLGTDHEKMLGQMLNGEPFFITYYPRKLKPFYIQWVEDDPTLSCSFDFDFGLMELVSGGQRIHEKEKLVENMKFLGLNPQKFEHHIKTFEWGMPPHGGFGMGGDRLVMVLTGVSNIREAVLFPRDIKRLTP